MKDRQYGTMKNLGYDRTDRSSHSRDRLTPRRSLNSMLLLCIQCTTRTSS